MLRGIKVSTKNDNLMVPHGYRGQNFIMFLLNVRSAFFFLGSI